MGRQQITNGERVSNRQLYETLRDFPTRRELRLTVGIALVLGQVLAAATSPGDIRAEQLFRAVLAWI